MPLSQATSATGTSILRGDGGSPETFTKIGEVTDFSGLGIKNDMVETTNFDSPDNYKEWLPTFKDGGSVKLGMNFVPSDSQQNPSDGLMADADDQVLRSFQIAFSDTGSHVAHFSAYVSDFEVSGKVGGKIDCSYTLRITGNVTWTNS